MKEKCPSNGDRESFCVRVMSMGGNAIVCRKTLDKLISLASAKCTIDVTEEELDRTNIVLALVCPSGTA